METPVESAQERTIREFLLRRIPRLVELQGEARLEQFRSRRVKKLKRPIRRSVSTASIALPEAVRYISWGDR
jgi:hypothetical protein